MKQLMILVTLAACGVDAPSSTATWSVDYASTNGAILGVWGTSPTDVWAVGGQADQSLVLHGDGTHWTPVPTPGNALLYSTYGFSISDVYAVGEHGLVLHYDGTAWSQVATGTTAPLFGLWGASGDDVWIVGGDLAGPAGSAVVLRGTRGVFQPVAIPAELAPNVLYKAHGYAADDVMIVGNDGAVLRWNGTAWRRDSVPTTAPLLSTWGSGDGDVFAVGGNESGEILHNDGAAWSQVASLATGEGLSGVFTSADAPAFAVGPHHVFEVARDGALSQATLPAGADRTVLHGVWGDRAGSTYVVGGALDAYPAPMTGVILRGR